MVPIYLGLLGLLLLGFGGFVYKVRSLSGNSMNMSTRVYQVNPGPDPKLVHHGLTRVGLFAG